MELPHIGQHCSESSCKKLDFLPIKCDACNEIFCGEHYQFRNHNCKNSYKKDNQVPVCPLCNTPIPLPYGASPDVVVGSHIDNDCQSDPAKNRRKVFTNRCSLSGCKTKEIVPIVCNDCNKNFCLKHRFQNDHKCSRGNSAQKQSKSNLLKTKPETQQKAKAMSTSQSHSVGALQNNLSEDEALAMALSLSLQDNQEARLTQEQIDFALACQLQEEQNQQTPVAVGGTRSQRDRCNVS